jgi:mannosyl-3-phosphoglycerate phosphatase
MNYVSVATDGRPKKDCETSIMKNIVFTDLDGTLIDSKSYSFVAAQPALERLRQLEIPLVFVTSKTRSEVEMWRNRLRNAHPFIVENGGAIFVPSHYFSFPLHFFERRSPYEVLQLGDSYESLVAVLGIASQQTQCRIREFYDMTAEEVSACCELPLDQAVLAKQREFDEPFEILEHGGKEDLLKAIELSGKQWTQGGRFFHITGANDKARAVRLLCELYRTAYSDIITIGLGDGVNDLPFLSIMDIPVLITSPGFGLSRSRFPHANANPELGPAGWNQAILELVPK